MWRRARLLAWLPFAGAAVIGLAVAAVQAQNRAAPAEPGANDESAAGAPEMTGLRAELELLRDRVAQLEERVSQLEGGIQPLEFRYTPEQGSGPEFLTPAPGDPRRAPQGEINGIPYYVIPLRTE